MARKGKLIVLAQSGYSITHDGECYVLTKHGDGQSKSNTYHSTLDHAVISLFERVLPERIAQRPDYHASMAELLEIVREVREELTSALSLTATARNPSGRMNSDKRHPDMAEGETSSLEGVGA